MTLHASTRGRRAHTSTDDGARPGGRRRLGAMLCEPLESRRLLSAATVWVSHLSETTTTEGAETIHFHITLNNSDMMTNRT